MTALRSVLVEAGGLVDGRQSVLAAAIALGREPVRQPVVDVLRMLGWQAFNICVGNADGHGKNISFIIDTDNGTISLAPAYDTVPTALW